MKGYKDHDRSPERREYLIPVAQTFRPEVCSRREVAAVGGSFLLPPLRMGWSMSVAWTRISAPTNKPVRSSGSLLAKVRCYLLRRWQAGSFISPAMTTNSTQSTRRPASWNGHLRPPESAVTRAAIFTAYFQRPRPCRTLGIIFFLPRGVDGAVDFGSGDGDVYALDAVSGCLKWKFKTGDDAEIHDHVGIHP